MPTNYSGDDAAVTARAAVVVSVPIDADPQQASSYNPAVQKLADIADHLETKAGLLDVASTWTAAQTFNSIAGVASNIPLTGPNPAGNTALTDTLHPVSILKAAAYWSNTSPTSPLSSLNIASCGLVSANTAAAFTFAAPMLTPYWVAVTMVYRTTFSNAYCFSVDQTTTVFVVRAYDPAAPATPIALNSGDPFAFMALVFGGQ